MRSPSKHKFVTMDATRGIAAICVMIFHFTQHRASETWLFGNGNIAVDYFLCLSGFVIAYSYGDKLNSGMTTREFFKVRLIRLYPMYLTGTCIGLASAFAYWLTCDLNKWNSLLLSGAFAIAFLPYFRAFAVQTGDSITINFLFPHNHPAWSLFFEIAVNLFYAVASLSKRSLLLLLALSFLYIVMTTHLFHGPSGWSFNNFPAGIPRAIFSFFIGALLFELWKVGKWRHLHLGPAVPCLLVALICAVPYSFASYLAMVLTAGPLIVWLSIANPASTLLTTLFLFLGEISYPLYAIHAPIYTLFQLVYNNATGNPADTTLPIPTLFGLGFLVIVIAFFLSKSVDRPVRNWLTSRF